MATSPALAVVCNASGFLPHYQKCARCHMCLLCYLPECVKEAFQRMWQWHPSILCHTVLPQPALLLYEACQPTSLNPHCALSCYRGLCPAMLEVGCKLPVVIIQETRRKLNPMNNLLCPAEVSCSGLLTVWSPCSELLLLIQMMWWVEESFSFPQCCSHRMAPLHLPHAHGTAFVLFAGFGNAEEYRLSAGLSMAKKLHCQALRCCNALYCDLPLKLKKKKNSQKIQLLQNNFSRPQLTSITVSASLPALADSKSAAYLSILQPETWSKQKSWHHIAVGSHELQLRWCKAYLVGKWSQILFAAVAQG